MKKIFSLPRLAAALFLALALSGCAAPAPPMDRPAADGNYHYQNAELGFSLVLPPEFIYYQTQRKKISGAIELAFFVPTSDTQHEQEVPGYAKPVTVMVYEDKDWQKFSADEQADLNVAGRTKSRVYTIEFWPKAPADWSGKWTESMRQKILADFKTI